MEQNDIIGKHYAQIYENYERRIRGNYDSASQFKKAIILRGLENLTEAIEELPEDDAIIGRLSRMKGVATFYRGDKMRYTKKDVEAYIQTLPNKTRIHINEIVERGIEPKKLNEALRKLRLKGITQEKIALELGANISTLRVDISHIRRGSCPNTMNAVKFYEYLIKEELI